MSPSSHDSPPPVLPLSRAAGEGDGPNAAGTPLPAEPPAGPSLWARAARIFVSPAQAWEGLQTRSRWWFPLAILLLLQLGGLLATYHRAMVPMQVEVWGELVDRGQMTQTQVDKGEEFMGSPMGELIVVGSQVVVFIILMLLIALVVWFGVGFVLGSRFAYRSALEVVCWAWFVRIPETILTFVIAWSQESFKGIHFGLGALLPAEEAVTKLHGALSVLLDSVGPFSIWYLFVAIVGCSALSGAPRKNVAWVLAGLYLALTVVFAGVALIFGPGA